MNQVIKVKGHLKVVSKDAVTGKILQIEEGPNLVLNTGLESLCKLMAGDIIVPSDVNPNDILNKTYKANPNLPLYGQFGTNAIAPRATNTPSRFNGTLDDNLVTPREASDIIRVNSFYTDQTSLTIQLLLPPTKGNGIGEGFMIYREAVLMCKVSDAPIRYKWFARKVFGDIEKSASTLIEAEWTFSFLAG